MEKNGKKDFLFSVIMPIYNVEEFLDESITSVINQTVGFKDNIQIILVNDGSPDNSEEICLKYRALYPDNIIYIKQKNAGVSAARNTGVKYATGKYINFFDSDDKWDTKAFKVIRDFMESNPDVPFIACRHYMFGRRIGFVHPLDYKYTENKIVNIEEDYDYIQMSVHDVVFRKEVIEGKEFDTRLRIGEDAKYISEIMIDVKKYGVLKDAVYLYRKRDSGDSAMDMKLDNISWYKENFEVFHDHFFNESKKRYGKVLRYFQYMSMYEMQWRLREKVPASMYDAVVEDYRKAMIRILQDIDDDIIVNQKNMNQVWKMYALSLKYNEDVFKKLKRVDSIFYYKDQPVISAKSKNNVTIKLLEINGGILHIEGYNKFIFLGDDYKLGVLYNNKFHEVKKFPCKAFEVTNFAGEVILPGECFELELPLKVGASIQFAMKDKKDEIFPVKVSTDKMAKLNVKFTSSSYTKDGYLLRCRRNIIYVLKDNLKNRLKSEFRYDLSLLKQKQIGIILYRWLAKVARTLKKKEIWIISDRAIEAGDNGEALFKYLCKQNNNDIRVYFQIRKDSLDYNRMRQYGKVLKYGSFSNKMKVLCADKIISSHIDEYVFNLFSEKERFMRDFANYDFVFLQHGITQGDVSSWLGKIRKNIKLLVCAGKDEYDQFLKFNYRYDTAVVKMLGFPRYDYLEDDPKKVIAFLPTWRKELASPMDSNGVRPISDKLKNSDYCKFYNDLINNEKLIKVMKKYGYKGEFYMHPSFCGSEVFFKGNDTIEVKSGVASYSSVFKKSNVLITDYSSVAMDFAYLKKPVVYTQFDADSFFSGHIYTNTDHFSYEKSGFGPVCHDLKSSIDSIVKYIENKCVMEEQYKKRVDKFFCYTDKDNCKRVYEAILSINSSDKKTK